MIAATILLHDAGNKLKTFYSGLHTYVILCDTYILTVVVVTLTLPPLFVSSFHILQICTRSPTRWYDTAIYIKLDSKMASMSIT